MLVVNDVVNVMAAYQSVVQAFGTRVPHACAVGTIKSALNK